VLVLADAADEAVAVLREPFDDRLQVVHLEGHAAQSQLSCHGSGRSRLVVGPDEARQLDTGRSSPDGQEKPYEPSGKVPWSTATLPGRHTPLQVRPCCTWFRRPGTIGVEIGLWAA
jgi:hypothetical protein